MIPCYFELFTDEARDNPNHEDHFCFTPPQPLKHTKYTKFGQLASIDLDQLAPGQVLYHIPPSVPPEYRANHVGGMIRFHHDVDYRTELKNLNRLFLASLTNLIHVVSSPQCAGLPDLRYYFDRHSDHIGMVFQTITHLISILREHQARANLISHFRRQIQLNRTKIQKLKSLSSQVDNVLSAMSPPTPPQTSPDQ